ncbi:hypothetical protein COLO4_28335 [Corchorus olitorius]|uniref:Uncharacterized protein n=1 Tax=Corchorus olitorius TaxID=93759 RepID=A0A1R3HLU3_9ROSI|nr:hypothetical protein COLO4_28335 [Corchorus olitorius]
MLVAHTCATPYVEAYEESYECAFRAFEVDEVLIPPGPSVMSVQMLKKQGWRKYAQGMKEASADCKQNMGLGLGFEATAKDRKIVGEARKQRKAERMGKATTEGKKIDARALYQNFKPFGWDGEDKDQQGQEEEEMDQKMKGLAINAVTEEEPESHPWVYPMAPGEESSLLDGMVKMRISKVKKKKRWIRR